MNKKGFTLIELIGVIVLISLMVLIIAPTVNRVIKQGQVNSDKQVKENIVLAAKSWTADHKSELKTLEKNWTKCISLQQLQEEGYIDKDIKLPSTGQNYSDVYVQIKNISENKNRQVFEYKLDDNECENTVKDTEVTIIGKKADNTTYNHEWTNQNITLQAVNAKTGSAPSGNNYVYHWKETTSNKNTTSTTNIKKIKVSSGNIQTYNYQVRMNVGGNDYTPFGPTTPYIVKIDKKAPKVSVSWEQWENKIEVTFDESNIGSQEQSKLKANQTFYYGFSTSKENPPTQYYSIKTNNAEGATRTTVRLNHNVITSLETNKYYVWIKEGVKDIAGNTSKNFVSADNYLIDNTAPTCSISRATENGDHGWYKEHNVDLTLSTTDTTSNPNSDIRGYGFMTTQKSQSKYNYDTSIYNNVSSASQGDTPGITWYGYVIDNAGNINNCNSGSFKVDTTKPSCSVSTSGTKGTDFDTSRWYKEKDVDVAINAYDNGTAGIRSGLSTYDLTKNASPSYSLSASSNNMVTTYKQSDTGPTKIKWYGYAKDAAGNINDCESTEFRVDTVKPTVPTISMYKWKDNDTTPTTEEGLETYTNNTWLSGKVFTKPSSTDPNEEQGLASGVSYYLYTTTGRATNYTDKKAGYKNISAQGTSYIKWKSCDKAGNCSNYSSNKTIRLDRTKPSAPTINMYKWSDNSTDPSEYTNSQLNRLDSYSSNTWSNKNIFIKASGSYDKFDGEECTSNDDCSKGLKYYRVTTGVASNDNDREGQSRNIKAEGTSYIKYKVCDKVNNCTDYTSEKIIKIDKTKPTCTLKVETSGVKWNSRKDDFPTSGGTISYELNTSSSTPSSYSNNSSQSLAQSTFYGHVKDAAGNTGKCSATLTSTYVSKYQKTTQTCGDHGYWGTCYSSCTANISCPIDQGGCCANTHCGSVCSRDCLFKETVNGSDKYSCTVQTSSSCWNSNYYFTSSTSTETGTPATCSTTSWFSCGSWSSGSSYVSNCEATEHKCTSGKTKLNDTYCYTTSS